jgi:hypothetical protein
MERIIQVHKIGKTMKRIFYPTAVLMGLLLTIGLTFVSCNKKGPAENDITPNVTGTLTLPAPAEGKTWTVIIDNDFDPGNGWVASGLGVCGAGTAVGYSIRDVPTGTYFIYAAVFVSGVDDLVPGDYYGIYGGSLADPPPLPNAIIPSSGTTTFDITLYRFGQAGVTTVTGTLTLPADADGVPYVVIIDQDVDPGNGFVSIGEGICGSGTSINYTIDNIPAGTYYVIAVVYVVTGTAQTAQSGDYVGVYGGTWVNPPIQPNAVIPNLGAVNFNIILHIM